MIKFFTLSLVIILFSSGECLKADSTFFSTSFFYTHGAYSESRKSNSFAFYNTVGITNNIYLIAHYDHLPIKSRDWEYLQQSFLGGLFVDIFPYYLKFNYAHYKGKFNYLPVPDEYSDFTNLYSTDLFYYTDGYYFGIAYNYLNLIGETYDEFGFKDFSKKTVNQLTLRIEKILSYDLFLSLKPSFTKVSDGRVLFSLALMMHYLLLPEILIRIGGFAGERAYYFDSDLLTIFNQDPTQKYQAFIQSDFSITNDLKFIAAYQHTKFTLFEINYYIAGIRTSLFL